jgi:hypothetical protein
LGHLGLFVAEKAGLEPQYKLIIWNGFPTDTEDSGKVGEMEVTRMPKLNNATRLASSWDDRVPVSQLRLC